MDFSRDAFDGQPVPVTDSHVLDPGEQQRLSGQNARILARLEQGPMTRDEIAAMLDFIADCVMAGAERQRLPAEPAARTAGAGVSEHREPAQASDRRARRRGAGRDEVAPAVQPSKTKKLFTVEPE